MTPVEQIWRPLEDRPPDGGASLGTSPETSPTKDEASSLASVNTIISSDDVPGRSSPFTSAFGASPRSPPPERKPENVASAIPRQDPTSPTSSKTRMFSFPGGAFFGLANFLPRRLIDDSSGVSVLSSEASGLEDQDADTRLPTNQPYESPPVPESSYYVFDPAVSKWASYLYKATDETGGEKYQADRVPLELAPVDSGQAAYVIGVSSKDDSSLAKRQPAPNDAYKVEGGHGSHIASSDTVSPGANGAFDLTQNSVNADGPQVTAAHARGYFKLWGVNHSVAQDIKKKACDRLEFKRVSKSRMHVIDESGKHVKGAKRMYLVNDEDVQGIVETTMIQIRSIRANDEAHHYGQGTPGMDSSSTLKLDGINNTIMPRSGALADPATTISMPKTTFTNMCPVDMQVHTKTMGQDSSTTATVVSRQSVAEITWAQPGPREVTTDPHVVPKNKLRGLSECSSSSHPESTDRSVASGPTLERISLSGFSLNQRTTPEAYADLVADISRAQNFNTPKESVSNMTTFPDLRSRHCTEEWLNPPVEMEQLVRSVSIDLYNQGVDAHSGSVSDLPRTCLEEPLKPRHCDRSLFNEAAFLCDDEVVVRERKSTQTSQATRETADKRLGTSIGLASHRRRSTQALQPINISPGSPDGLLPSLIGKIRKGGHKIFHRHHSMRASGKAELITPHNSIADEQHPRSAPRSRDSIVKALTPQPPRMDNVGIYEAMTGSSRLTPTRKRKDTCSEDDRPHVCEEDLETAPRVLPPA